METQPFDATTPARDLSAVALNLEMGFRFGELVKAIEAAGIYDAHRDTLDRLFALQKEAGARALMLRAGIPEKDA